MDCGSPLPLWDGAGGPGAATPFQPPAPRLPRKAPEGWRTPKIAASASWPCGLRQPSAALGWGRRPGGGHAVPAARSAVSPKAPEGWRTPKIAAAGSRPCGLRQPSAALGRGRRPGVAIADGGPAEAALANSVDRDRATSHVVDDHVGVDLTLDQFHQNACELVSAATTRNATWPPEGQLPVLVCG